MSADQEIVADALETLAACGEYLGRKGIQDDEAWALFSRVTDVMARVKRQLEAAEG